MMNGTGVFIRAGLQPDSTPATWSSRTAVGRFEIERLSFGQANVNLASIGDLTIGQFHRLFRKQTDIFQYFKDVDIMIAKAHPLNIWGKTEIPPMGS